MYGTLQPYWHMHTPQLGKSRPKAGDWVLEEGPLGFARNPQTPESQYRDRMPERKENNRGAKRQEGGEKTA